jgi:hypothetical protein
MKGLERDMPKLILALLFAAFAVVIFSCDSGATNYSEQKKFDLSAPTDRVTSRRHDNLKVHSNCYYRNK